MKELNFKEYVETTIRRHELLSGPVDVDGEIDQFGQFTITIHGRKGDIVYNAEDMEAYYESYLTEQAGRCGERVEAVY